MLSGATTLAFFALLGADAPAAGASAVSERVQAAHALVDGMRGQLERVSHHHDEARAEKDIVKLNYLSTKLSAIAGLVKVCEQAERNLQDAVLRHDTAAANHEEEKLAIAREKVNKLFAESETAVGELAVYGGQTEVQFSVDESIAGPLTQRVEALLAATSANTIVLVRPPAASPYQ